MIKCDKQLLFLELNEVNFDNIEVYAAQGKLPNFRKLIRSNGIQTTTSEQRYEHLEPWIQWVTAHTGLTFAEHGVFRLGDIVDRDIPQIWEHLEDEGLRVGAVSPMNAKHRLRNAAFFIPDPWTRTDVSAGAVLRRMHAAMSQAVNDNATSSIDSSSIGALIAATAIYARPANYALYLRLALRSLRHHWLRAVFLDLLLSDIFIREVARTRPHFATLFLNAAAHLQHHYMFSAKSYKGPHRNPEWYLRAGVDPVFEIYDLYDRIVGQVQRVFPAARLMIATGLHQVPHQEATYYWRLSNHAEFLRRIGVEFDAVQPRMSRDFLVTCSSEASARDVQLRLEQTVHEDGTQLFEVDNRGKDLFVVLTYPREIRREARFAVGSQDYGRLFKHVAFVALKNGEHNGMGYFLDSSSPSPHEKREFPLTEIPRRIMAALGVG